MARTKAFELSNKSKGSAYLSGMGYKGVLRRGSKYGWKYEDGKTCQQKGGFDTAEEAAYHYDEFLLHYVGPNADTNQALGLLKLKHVLEIRERIRKAERPVNKAIDKRGDKIGATGFKGVSANNSKVKPFKAQIYINGKYVHIGTFPTAEEAARAYDLFVLQHIGSQAVTNISLGLLPPIGEPPKAAPVKPRGYETPVELEEEDAEPYTPPRTPEEEREAQRLAALAMSDEEEQELEEVQADPAVRAVPAEEVAPPSPVMTTELIVMSDADKLRAKAEAMLREAAEMDAGNIKRQAAEQITALSNKIQTMQQTMLSLIDCCADVELQLARLRDFLK